MNSSTVTRTVLRDAALAVPEGTAKIQTTALVHSLVAFDRRYAGLTTDLLNRSLRKEGVRLVPVPSYDGPAAEPSIREGVLVTSLLRAVVR